MSERSGRPLLQERSLKPLTSLKRLNTFPAFKLGPDQDTSGFNDQELESLRLLARSLINQKQKGKKRSYTREEKLKYIQLYKNTYVETEPGVRSLISKRQAAKNFGISHSIFINWLRKEDQLRSCRSGTRSMNNKPASWPEFEEKIYGDFMEWRKRRRAINKAWFLRTAKKYFFELYPNEVVVNPEDGSKTYGSKFSSGWFHRFKERWRISWRAKTRIASKTPAEAEPLILNWLRFNRRVSQVRDRESPAEIGRYYRCDFYNMDQTPLPFEFLEGKTYEIKGNKTIWVRTIGNGWHKRQATLMIAICADGNLGNQIWRSKAIDTIIKFGP